MSDESCVYIARHLTQLRTLNIAHCDVTDACLLALVEHRWDTLEGLFVGNCISMTRAGFTMVLNGCLRLQTLGIGIGTTTRRTHSILDLSLLGRIRALQVRGGSDNHAIVLACSKLKNLYLACDTIDQVVVPNETQLPELGSLHYYLSDLNVLPPGPVDTTEIDVGESVLPSLRRQRPTVRIHHDPRGDTWPSNVLTLPL